MLDAERAKTPAFGYGSATAFFAIFSALLWFRFWNVPGMVAFPEIFSLAAPLPILFYVIATAPKEKAGKIAGLASCVLWVLGIALAFVIPPSSQFIFVPDSLLMFGFFPLLFAWRFSWTWLIFGVLNIGIGIFLLMLQFMSDSYFPNANQIDIKHHLTAFHPGICWWLTGALATAFGFGRLVKNVYLMVRKARSAA